MRDHRPNAATLAMALAVSVAAGGAGACSLSQEGVGPPPDRIYYPTSALIDPSGRWLFVVNSNSDLRYNDGTLVAVDLDAAKADRDPAAPWDDCPQVGYVPPSSNPTHFCCRDALDTGVLDCDERSYVLSKSTQKIGSFGAGTVWQDHYGTDPMPVPRLFIGVRGNGSVTWLTVAIDNANSDQPVMLGCNPDQTGACTNVIASEDISGVAVNLPDEPYALGLDKAANLLYVGHLLAGAISIINVDKVDLGKPTSFAPFTGVFPPDINGNAGVTSIIFPDFQPLDTSGRPIFGPNEFFASSRYVPTVMGFTPTRLPSASDMDALSSENIGLSTTAHVFATSLQGGAETRGVRFVQNPDGTLRAFVLQRTPPTLITYEVGTQPGQAFSVATEITETCGSPTFLYKHTSADGELLYVNCFDDNRVYVFDPLGPDLIGTVDAGQGPAGLVFDDNKDPRFAYVIGFGANNISVLDLDQRRVVQRIGFPSKQPR